MSESNESQPATKIIETFFVPKSSSFPHDVRFHFRPNEVDRTLEILAETREPLASAEVEQVREILNRPRDSPPDQKQFESFCRDVDQHGFFKALNDLLDIGTKQEGEEEGEVEGDEEDEEGEHQHEREYKGEEGQEALLSRMDSMAIKY